MSPATHFLSGWVFANCFDIDRRDRMLITFAAVIPDIDGIGVIAEIATRNSSHPLPWFTEYHHLLHNVWFAIVCALIAVAVAHRKWLTSAMVFAAFHLHLLGDIVGAKGPEGYSWPIPYLWPVNKNVSLSWSHEWPLNGWQNWLITFLLLAISVWIIRARRRSPVEPFSVAADQAVTEAFLKRMQPAA